MTKDILRTLTYFLIVMLLGLLLMATLTRPFISDEFHEAVLVNKLFSLTPYKDFIFYKNLLGYYFKLPILLLPTTWWNKLILSRLFLFFIFTLWFGYTLIKSQKWFSFIPFGISLVLSAFITQSFLHTTAYRVDLLTMISGFLTLLLVMEQRYLLGGVTLGLSFLISQKAGLYFGPSFLCLLFLSTERRNSVVIFIVSLLAPILIYICFWSNFSDFKTVLHTMFIRDTVMATSAGLNVRWYWLKSLKENTLIFSLVFIGFFPQFWKDFSREQKASLLFCSSLLFQALLLGQPWPHWFILWCPFFVFPLYSFFSKLQSSQKSELFIIAIIFMCLGQSLGNLFYRYQFNNSYQQFNILLMESFLRKGDSYLAGVDVHSDYIQKPEELREMYAINRLKIINSTGVEKTELVEKFKNDPPKILFYNYRLSEFIPEIQALFSMNYYHFWGNIYAYKIHLNKGKHNYKIPFKGRFAVSGGELLEISYMNQNWKRGTFLDLKQGYVEIESNRVGSLNLIPKRYKVKLDKDLITPRSLHLTFDSK